MGSVRISALLYRNLVAKDLPVYTYGARGELITEFPYMQVQED